MCLRADSYLCFVSRKDLLSLDRLLSRLDHVRDVVDYALWVVGNFVDIEGVR